MQAVHAAQGHRAAGANPVTVVVVGADPGARRTATSLLAQTTNVRVVGEVSDARRTTALLDALRPRVVLLDLGTPQHTDLQAVTYLAQHAAVLVLMNDADAESVRWAVRAGALGYLIHGHFTAAELCHAVQAAARGEARLAQRAMDALVDLVRSLPDPERWSSSPQRDRLSQREIEIMRHIVRGAANSDIAQQLYLSEKTVRNHVNHIYAKLGVRNRAQAMASWLGTGTAA